MNCTADACYVMLMAICTCTSLHYPLKLLTSIIFCCISIQVSRDDFYIETYMCVLGL